MWSSKPYGTLTLQVILELTKQQQKEETTVLVFSIQQLGTDACVKTYNLQAVAYLKTISLDYYDVLGKANYMLSC